MDNIPINNTLSDPILKILEKLNHYKTTHGVQLPPHLTCSYPECKAFKFSISGLCMEHASLVPVAQRQPLFMDVNQVKACNQCDKPFQRFFSSKYVLSNLPIAHIELISMIKILQTALHRLWEHFLQGVHETKSSSSPSRS